MMLKKIQSVLRNFPHLLRIFLFDKNLKKVKAACIMQGGLGDMLRQKCILLELTKMSPDIIIDSYGRGSKRILKGLKNVRFVLDRNLLDITKNKYDIIFDIFSYKVKILKLSGDALSKRILENLKKYNAKNFKLKRYHLITQLKMDAGVDNVENIDMAIDYKTTSLEKFSIFPNTKYITFQLGYGDSGENDAIKCWEISNWQKLLSILKQSFGGEIKIAQVGKSKQTLPYVDINASNKTSIDELCSLLKNSLLHIDIDGACMHIATALGTKVLALEGPNNVDYCAYPQNINIVSSLAKECWEKNAKEFFTHACISDKTCAIYKNVRSCLTLIEPQGVAELALNYLKSIDAIK